MNVIYTIIASFTNGEIGIGENNVLTRERFELSNCPERIVSFQEKLKTRYKYILIQGYEFNWLTSF